MQTLSRQNTFSFIFSLMAVGFALYLFNPVHYYFLNDDLIHIPLSKQGVLFQRQSYRPMGDLSVRLDYLLWEKKAWGYHLTNLLLHIANSVLIYFLAKRLFEKYAEKNGVLESGMTAVIFFIYAFHSESVFWIIGRSGSLGTLFFIPAILFYLNRNSKSVNFLLSLLFFALGLMAYESVWIFPLVAIIISIADRKLLAVNSRREVVFIAAILMFFFLHLFIRNLVIGEVIGAYEGKSFLQMDIPGLLLNSIKLSIRAFVPPFARELYFIIAVLLLALIFAFVLVLFGRKKNKNGIFFLWLVSGLFVVSILPYLSVGIDTHGVEGERYLYLPSVFASILIVGCINFLTNARRVQVVLYCLVVAFHLIFLARSASYYKTASAIVETTFSQIDLLGGRKTLFIDSLPQTYNGALIFRLGFEEGLEWLKPQNNLGSVFIVSQKTNNQHWSSTFFAEHLNNGPATEINQILIRDTTQQKTYVPLITHVLFNPETDARFIFKDQKLEVFR